MDLLLKILMILGSAILIFNAAARPDNTLLVSIVGLPTTATLLDFLALETNVSPELPQ